MAFMACAMSAEHWMRRNAPNEVCMLVAENNDQAKNFIADSQIYHQDKRIIDQLSVWERKHFPLRKIKEDPLFQPKRQSHPLIVADFIAYVWKRVLMKDRRYDRFMRPMIGQVITFSDDDKLARAS
jgi:hypothetical protein